MGLELLFSWDREKSSSLDEVHLGVVDGCQVEIEPDSTGLSWGQRVIIFSGIPQGQNLLFYRAHWWIEKNFPLGGYNIISFFHQYVTGGDHQL